MSTPNYIEQVPDYLAGDLNPGERTAFEKALAERRDLREAMVIWEELDVVLAPAPEDKLLENIARLKAEEKAASSKNSWPWLLGISVLVSLAVMAWFLWPEGQASIEPNKPVTPQTQGNVMPETDAPDLRLETEESAKPIKPPETAPPQREIPPASLQEKEDEAEDTAPLVFAVNYAPNPLIEAEMTDQLRGGEVSLELATPTPEATIESTNGSIALSFNGQLNTELTQDELTVRLLLLSNKPEDYQQSNYLTALPAVLTPSNNGYTLTIEGTAKAEPGLYYYFLEWEEEETYLEVGRLRVE